MSFHDSLKNSTHFTGSNTIASHVFHPCVHRYIDPQPESYAASLSDFREILNSYSPKTYTSLFAIGALEDRFLDLLFQDLFIEILPPDVVLRIIDAFLLEGSKILHRYGLAIIRAYKTQIKAGTYSTATNFWLAVKADAANAATKANTPMLYKVLGKEERLPVADSFVIFSKAKNPEFLESNMIYDFAFDEDRSMFSKMMRPMNLTTSSNRRSSFSSPFSALNNNSAGGVQSGSQKGRKSSIVTGAGSGATARASVADMVLNQNPGVNQNQDFGATPPPPGPSAVLGRRGSATSANINSKLRGSGTGESMKTGTTQDSAELSASAFNSPAGNTTGANASSAMSGGSAFSPVYQNNNNTEDSAEGLDLDAAASAISFASAILSTSSAQRLLRALNQPVPVRGYHLTFSTADHGYSLRSLYSHVDGCSPCLLLIQLAAPHEKVTVGAFVHSSLEASERCKGDARTAVFRVTETGVDCYPWVGLQRQEGAQAQEESSGRQTAARFQFLVADSAYLSFGACVESGSNALRVDADLRSLHTGASDTYGNPCLLVDRDSADVNVQIRAVEVYCGTSAGTAQSAAQSSASTCLSDITNT